MKSLKSRKLMVVLVVLLLCVTVSLIYNKLLRPPKLFRRYVLNPIPASVSNIMADQVKLYKTYWYAFRFDINRADLDLIIKTRPFREAQITNFMNGGGLYWKWKGLPLNGNNVELGCGFGISRRKPSWYTLESWDSPEVFALKKEEKIDGMDTTDMQVLIYNAKLGQAFFIVYHSWGT